MKLTGILVVYLPALRRGKIVLCRGDAVRLDEVKWAGRADAGEFFTALD